MAGIAFFARESSRIASSARRWPAGASIADGSLRCASGPEIAEDLAIPKADATARPSDSMDVRRFMTTSTSYERARPSVLETDHGSPATFSGPACSAACIIDSTGALAGADCASQGAVIEDFTHGAQDCPRLRP